MALKSIILSAGIALIAASAHAQSMPTATEMAARAQLQQTRIDVAHAMQDLQNQAAQASADIRAAQMRSQQIQMEQAADVAQRQRDAAAAQTGQQQ